MCSPGSAMQEKKIKRSGGDGIGENLRLQRSGSKKMPETDSFGQSGGMERQAQVCTPSFLTALNLVTSGRDRITSEQYLVPPSMSQSISSLSPNFSGKASSNVTPSRQNICIHLFSFPR